MGDSCDVLGWVGPVMTYDLLKSLWIFIFLKLDPGLVVSWSLPGLNPCPVADLCLVISWYLWFILCSAIFFYMVVAGFLKLGESVFQYGS